jgi:hypothetical protein
MSQPAGTFNDGNLAFASQQVVIGSFTYVADNIDYDVATKIIERKNEVGVPVAEVLIQETGTGSMTVQIPATLSVPTSGCVPAVGASFSIKDADGVATINCKVTKVGRKMISDAENKFNVEFRQRYN